MRKGSPRRHDHTGKRFGKLTAVEVDKAAGIPIRWICVCDCGNKKSIRVSHLVDGNVTSCAAKECGIRGGSSERESMLRTKEYRTWIHMNERCYAPQSAHRENYRKLNIQVCEKWRNSYLDFLSDMGRAPTSKHTLDRIDPFGNYEPDNCRWATMLEQNRNKTNTLKVTIDGITRTASEWDILMGFPKQTVWWRVKNGWNDKDAVLTPLQKRLRKLPN